MKHLVNSFQQYAGYRGVHFYDEETCNFLPWNDVFLFIKSLEEKANTESDLFVERLTESLANYNPDTEFLAVCQDGETVSVELYCRSA